MSKATGWLSLVSLLFALAGCESLDPYQKMTLAIHEGDAATVSEMLRTHPRSGNGFDEFDWLPSAAAKGRPEVVKMLVEAGYQVNKTDGFGRTALSIEVRRADVDMVKLLLDHGADSATVDSKCSSPLNDAEMFANLEEADLSLATTGFVEYFDDHKWVQDIQRNKANYVAIVNLLKARGAKYNFGLLLEALQQDKCKNAIQRAFDLYKYDINATNELGNTAYHYATTAYWQNKFLEKGANPNIRNKQGYLAKDYWPILQGNAAANDNLRNAQLAKERAEIERKQAEQDARDRADMRNVRESNAAAKNPCGFAYSCTLGQGAEAKTYEGGKRVLKGKMVEECRLHPDAAYCN